MFKRLRLAAIERVRTWSFRRHGVDSLPITIHRRRIYIVPTRFGVLLGLSLVGMLLGGLNYNSNLGLAFAFLLISMTLVIMHHCNRNLLRLVIDATPQIDAFAGGSAALEFVLRNDSGVERRDVEVRCAPAGARVHVPAHDSATLQVPLPVERRGVQRLRQIELRTVYPFGWFHAWTYVHSPLVIYVAPAPAGGRALPLAQGEGASSVAEAAGEEEFSGLRTYRPGEPLKHMAWKVLARGGEAAVRTYTGYGAAPDWLAWDDLDGLDTEARLSQLCEWVLQSAAAHRTYGLRIPGTEIAPSRGTAHRFACLRALATHGGDA